jgi:hypothetical protein
MGVLVIEEAWRTYDCELPGCMNDVATGDNNARSRTVSKHEMVVRNQDEAGSRQITIHGNLASAVCAYPLIDITWHSLCPKQANLRLKLVA